MGSATKVRAIYAELRASVGVEASAGDLLRLAHFIVKSYAPDLDDSDVYGRPRDSRSFFALPVDVAMEDGGWRILHFEERRSFGIDDIDPQDFAILELHIRRNLGPQWRPAPSREYTLATKSETRGFEVENGKRKFKGTERSSQGASARRQSADSTGGTGLVRSFEPAGARLGDEEATHRS
jgi:hypothetical protein